MISVVIPLYNKADFIVKTIESVLSQTFQDFEIVVVNDGSTDGSVEAVEAIADNRIRIIHQENAGVSVARNNGIEHAKFEWVALLDGDDIWKPEYLQTQWDLHLKYPECDVCACNYEFCDYTGKVTPTKINKLPFDGDDGVLTNYFEVASCSHPPIWSSAVMAKREAFLSVGGFPVGVTSGEDLLTWARLAVKYKIAYSCSSLAIYNMGIGYDFKNPPPRSQDPIDYVGQGLLELFRNNKHIKWIRTYYGLWCKMRASVAIRLYNRSEAITQSLKSLKSNPLNVKVFGFIILSLMPKFIIKHVLFKYK